MLATWNSPQRNESITHPDNLLTFTLTFPCFPDFQGIILPNRRKHLCSHSNNMRYTQQLMFLFFSTITAEVLQGIESEVGL
jgi:hypothetical protein